MATMYGATQVSYVVTSKVPLPKAEQLQPATLTTQEGVFVWDGTKFVKQEK